MLKCKSNIVAVQLHLISFIKAEVRVVGISLILSIHCISEYVWVVSSLLRHEKLNFCYEPNDL